MWILQLKLTAVLLLGSISWERLNSSFCPPWRTSEQSLRSPVCRRWCLTGGTHSLCHRASHSEGLWSTRVPSGCQESSTEVYSHSAMNYSSSFAASWGSLACLWSSCLGGCVRIACSDWSQCSSGLHSLPSSCPQLCLAQFVCCSPADVVKQSRAHGGRRLGFHGP